MAGFGYVGPLFDDRTTTGECADCGRELPSDEFDLCGRCDSDRLQAWYDREQEASGV